MSDKRTAGHTAVRDLADQDVPKTLEAGLFLAVVGVPLIFFPMSTAPFADIKLVVLLAGALLIASSKPKVDRTIAIAAITWVGVVGLATILGVDPGWSLLGAPNQGNGLVLFVVCGYVAAAGTGLPRALIDRVPTWLVWTGVAIAVLAVLQRFVGIGTATWEFGRTGSTLGQPVVLGTFMALSIVATTAWRTGLPSVAPVLVLGSGLAVSANRSGWIGAGLALALIWSISKQSRTRVLQVALALVTTLVIWTAIDLFVRPPQPVSGGARFTEIAEGTSANARPFVLSAYLRGWNDHRVTGWGPATGWGAFMSAATVDEMRGATERGWGDAHNILIESLTTTGAVGAGALISLLGIGFVRAFRRSDPLEWALGSAVALGVYHLLQPVNIALTPLLFLLIGIASGHDATFRLRKTTHAAFLVALALCALLGVTRLSASTLERYGRTYALSGGFRIALRLEPARLSARGALMTHRALDARSRNLAAATEARNLATDAVRRHPWHPGVRILAADVETLLDDHVRAKHWIEQQLERFENDPVALIGAATLAFQNRNLEEARAYAQRALALRPNDKRIWKLLEETATSSR